MIRESHITRTPKDPNRCASRTKPTPNRAPPMKRRASTRTEAESASSRTRAKQAAPSIKSEHRTAKTANRADESRVSRTCRARRRAARRKHMHATQQGNDISASAGARTLRTRPRTRSITRSRRSLHTTRDSADHFADAARFPALTLLGTSTTLVRAMEPYGRASSPTHGAEVASVRIALLLHESSIVKREQLTSCRGGAQWQSTFPSPYPAGLGHPAGFRS